MKGKALKASQKASPKPRQSIPKPPPCSPKPPEAFLKLPKASSKLTKAFPTPPKAFSKLPQASQSQRKDDVATQTPSGGSQAAISHSAAVSRAICSMQSAATCATDTSSLTGAGASDMVLETACALAATTCAQGSGSHPTWHSSSSAASA